MTYYTLKAIKQAIRDAGFGYNHYYLKALIDDGSIPEPKNSLKLHKEDNGNFKKDINIYTETEIAKIVKIYTEYSKKMTTNK